MSEIIQALHDVLQEITNLTRRKNKLTKKKMREGHLSDEEEDELEEIPEILAMFVEREKHWQGVISKDIKPEVLSKSFSEADGEWIKGVTKIDCDNLIDWTSFTLELDQTIAPSAGFQVAFENVSKAFHMTTETGRRVFLNLFLSDIILQPEFKNTLRIFPELELSVESVVNLVKHRLRGRTDYTVGFNQGKSIFAKEPPRELHLVAIEAKSNTMGTGDVYQCIAETAALYKSRKDARKDNCAVWGVLSNAERWKFIHIDHEGVLYQSKEYPLELRSYIHDEVKTIYQLLYYVVNCCYKSCTPNPTPASSSVELNE